MPYKELTAIPFRSLVFLSQWLFNQLPQLGEVSPWDNRKLSTNKKRYPRHVTAPIRINVCYFTNWARYRILDSEDRFFDPRFSSDSHWAGMRKSLYALAFAGSVVGKKSKNSPPNGGETWWFTIWFTIKPSICLMILRCLSVRPGDINYVSWVMHEKSLVFQSYLLRFGLLGHTSWRFVFWKHRDVMIVASHASTTKTPEKLQPPTWSAISCGEDPLRVR